MTNRTIPQELADVMAQAPPATNKDKVDKLRAMVTQARDLELQKADLEERIKDLSAQLEQLYWQDLPELMGEAGVSVMTLEATANHPEIEAKAQPFYAANIAASWPEEKRKAAFSWLDTNDHGDLIKTDVVVAFPRDQRTKALKFFESVSKKFKGAMVKENVHHTTLTAWLREQIENGESVPLDIIGGTVTRVVKLKEKKP